jgi:hypothetical protein
VGRIFTLSDDIRSIARDSIDDLIDQLGKECILVYPGKQEACGCNTNLAGAPSAGMGGWRTGGPSHSSSSQMCPLCKGTGVKYTETRETITMLLAWSPRDWKQYEPQIRVPEGGILSKTYITFLPKIKMCEEMLVQPPIQGLVHYRFRLAGEPIDPGNIIQGRYCICAWERIG